MKTYYEQNNVGRARYLLSFHDGVKKHRDGSPFFDVKIASNKRQHQKNINELKRQGYTTRPLCVTP